MSDRSSKSALYSPEQRSTLWRRQPLFVVKTSLISRWSIGSTVSFATRYKSTLPDATW